MLILILALVLVACESALVASSATEMPGDDQVAGLASAIRSAGATVRELGGFDPDPLGRRGVILCVAGQEVRLYVFDTEEDREAASARIDPNDPSNLGTAMVAWAGQPKFWQAERLLVLYLGTDPAVEAGLNSILGQPFARGQGRDPGPGRHAC